MKIVQIKKSLVLSFVFLATTMNSIDTKANSILSLNDCMVGSICTYIPSSSTDNKKLVSTVKSLIPEVAELTGTEGYLRAIGESYIYLTIHNQELLTKVKDLILNLDRYDTSSNKRNIDLNISIYELTEEAYSDLSFQAEVKAKDKGLSGIPNIVSNALSSVLKIGNIDLLSIFSAKKMSQNSEKVKFKPLILKNHGSINIDDTQPLLAETNIDSKERTAGLKVSGSAQYTRDKDGNEFIEISDFDLFYGVPVFKDEANTQLLTIDRTQEKFDRAIKVKVGQTIVISSIKETVKTNNKTTQILGYDKGKSRSITYRIITIEAPDKNKIKTKYMNGFSDQEINLFTNTSVSDKEVLNSMKFEPVKVMQNGDRRMILKLDSKFARSSNIKDNIEISISGAIKTKKILTVENLMKSGLFLPALQNFNLNKSKLRLSIKLKNISKKNISVRKKVYYNPLNNQFL